MMLMMRALVLSVVLSTSLLAQSMPAVTTDGRYVLASIRKTTSETEVPTLVVQATRGSWRREIPGGGNPRFLPDNRALLWQRRDTLWSLTLGTEAQTAVAVGVQAYQLLGRAPGGPWLVYRPCGAKETLVLRRLGTGRERRFPDVAEYVVAADESTLLLRTTTPATSTVAAGRENLSAARPSAGPTAERTTLRWVELSSGADRTIWTGIGQLAGGSRAFTFDGAGRQLVFAVETPGDSGRHQKLWHYAAGTPHATVLVQDGMTGVEEGFTVATSPTHQIRFSANGQRVFFWLREPARPQSMPGAADVWSYTDTKVQSQQLLRLMRRRTYAAVVALPERHVMRLEQEQDVMLGEPGDEHALLCAFDHDVIRVSEDGLVNELYTMSDYNWSRATRCSVTLVRLRDGTRTVLRAQLRNTSSTFPYFRLSPGGRYVVFYDPWQKEYGSYELASGVTRPLTRGVTARWASGDLEEGPRVFNAPSGIAAWLPGDVAVLVADSHNDLWQLDLAGRRPPVNLTNGYARRQQFQFRWGLERHPAPILDRKAVLLVEAERPWSARRMAPSGWYRVRLDRPGDPEPLVRLGSQYRYTSLSMGRAGADTVYVATRENMTEPPGAWYTRDFRTWTPVTDGRPEQRQAWPRELLTWKTFDGNEAQGVLIKPKDFDPHRKYPAVVDIYEKEAILSYSGGQFIAHCGSVRICPWVDAGYLVFKPNIHYTIGATGESVYNAVVAGTQYLATLPFVDGHRIGLRGHSFGGFETRYLLTRTSIFAAVYSSAGVSDFLSYYGTEEKDLGGFSYMATVEGGQHRLGGTPWERPDVYLRNSPVLHADKITTPLLMAHNYDDYRVPFSQSMELYMALRRLGKPVWLIAGSGGHGVPEYSDDLRIRQFFDHYLKGAPPPRWMTRGIPAARHGLETGLELDSTMAGPGPGLLETPGQTLPLERLLTQDRRWPD